MLQKCVKAVLYQFPFIYYHLFHHPFLSTKQILYETPHVPYLPVYQKLHEI